MTKKIIPQRDGVLPGVMIDGVWHTRPKINIHNESNIQAPSTQGTVETLRIKYSNYSSALALARCIYVLGWLVIVFGLFVMFSCVFLMFTVYANSKADFFVMALLAGFGLSFTGLLLATLSQLITATIQNAINPRSIVSLLESKSLQDIKINPDGNQ